MKRTNDDVPHPAAAALDAARFRSLIATQLGLAFEDAALDQLAALAAQRAKLVGTTPDAYLERVARGDAAELGAIAEALTAGETYFFRHAAQLAVFSEVALPARGRGAGKVRILSAGCSTGEEPYTLAMLAREAGIEVTIRAVDIRAAALRKASVGRYTAWTLRETSPERRRTWFVGQGREMVLDERIRKMVRFDRRNLTVDDAELWQRSAYDIVFCCDVLGYLAPEVARAVVARIERALAPGGYLFLGDAETPYATSLARCATDAAVYCQT